MARSFDIGTKVGDWTLQQAQLPTDDWWLRSQGPGKRFETEYDAQLNAKEGEHPQFRRGLKPVWVWVHGPTEHVHTAELEREEPTAEQAKRGEPGDLVLDEGGRPIPLDPPDDITPRSGADVTVTPPGERERIQTQIDQLNSRLAALEG
jgi:hypothetical protein